jgi:hypothetical protein
MALDKSRKPSLLEILVVNEFRLLRAHHVIADLLEAELLKRSMMLNNNNMALERHRMAVAAQAPLASAYLTALPSRQYAYD